MRIASILEIGAMDSPTFPDRDSRYLDWFTREELQAAIADNPRRLPERVVDPHYVVKQKRFAAEVGDRFSLIIANHVLEHIADPITWLQELRTLAPDGSLFLAVPDRRYTFDYLRPVSTAGDVLRAYHDDLERPSRWQMFDAIFYHRPILADAAWGGDLSRVVEQRFDIAEALDRSLQAEREYVDVHCHVFTADSFATLMRDLTPLTGWRVDEVGDVAVGANEFYAWLVADTT